VMTHLIPADDVLDVLACDWQQRPKGAPSFFDLQGAVQDVRREPEALVIRFDPAHAAEVEALVAAERQCCTSIGWQLESGAALELRISGTEAQLDIFQSFLTTLV